MNPEEVAAPKGGAPGLESGGAAASTAFFADVPQGGGARSRGLIPARLLIGFIVLICAEVFSGASLKIGLWHPWTLIVTFWLYFAHFFCFTTLAAWTRRTSFWCLYLWGVLFGLYEFWITKVIWHGYDGDGKFVAGQVGPYGFSEFSMVVLFHPLLSFLVPLAIACLLCPPLRRWFPDLAWFTGRTRPALVFRGYLVLAFGPIIAMNCGGTLQLVLNLVFVAAVVAVLHRLSRRYFQTAAPPSPVVLGRAGFIGICVYLAALYGLAYVYLRPEGLPSFKIQAFTFIFYALAILGLWRHRPRLPLEAAPVENTELKRALKTLAAVLGLGLVLSVLNGKPVLFFPVIVSLVTWTPVGLLLFLLALAKGVYWERTAR